MVGGVALLRAFFAFSVLPVNYAGLFVVLFGLSLFVLDPNIASWNRLQWWLRQLDRLQLSEPAA